MRTTITFCLLFLSVLSLQAQAPSVADSSLLWRISDNGLAQPSYLFGTIHMIPADDYFLPSTVIRAINDADQVAFEIDPREMQDPAMMFSLLGRINMRGDTSLKDLLSQEDYQTVSDYFNDAGLPMMLFERMKPMFLASMVGQDMSDLAGGLGNSDNIKSYEFELTELAEAGEKGILGLETMDFQLNLFDSIPYSFQAQMLVEAVEADGQGIDGDDQFSQMVKMYKRQAVAEMANILEDESEEGARFEELLLNKRNANWIPQMETLMSDGPMFFAVGAGHLGNDQGVISLLRAAGYKVEPVFGK